MALLRALDWDFLSDAAAGTLPLAGAPFRCDACFRWLLCDGDGVVRPAALRVASFTPDGVPPPPPAAGVLRAGWTSFFAGDAFIDAVESTRSMGDSTACCFSGMVLAPGAPARSESATDRGVLRLYSFFSSTHSNTNTKERGAGPNHVRALQELWGGEICGCVANGALRRYAVWSAHARALPV